MLGVVANCHMLKICYMKENVTEGIVKQNECAF